MPPTDTEAQQIWQFAHGVNALGLRCNISFGRVVNMPPGVPPDTVRTYKHSNGQGIVTVWPFEGDDGLERQVSELAAEYGMVHSVGRRVH